LGPSFVPPFCPNEKCPRHLTPLPGFWQARGYYQPRCRKEPVPRFRCRHCSRGFSRQTFRVDYRDHRPECNQRLLEELSSGVGLRQAGRIVHLSVGAVQRKARKLAKACRLLHQNLFTALPNGRTLALDEEETYEHASIRTLTMPVIIDNDTRFVIASAVGTTRRLARLGTGRRRRQDREEKAGRRRDESRQCVLAVLQFADSRLAGNTLTLRTDEKASYRVLAKQVFGSRVIHETTSGQAPRTTYNPLFGINSTLAMSRDNCGRLRRKSWLVTKKREFLQLHMQAFIAYRNYVRCRFNRDADGASPAVHLKLLPRNLRFDQVIAWRQEFGRQSIHPLDDDGSSPGHQYPAKAGWIEYRPPAAPPPGLSTESISS
jgi:hypothetical protein